MTDERVLDWDKIKTVDDLKAVTKISIECLVAGVTGRRAPGPLLFDIDVWPEIKHLCKEPDVPLIPRQSESSIDP